MDNRGNRLLVSNNDSAINLPAVGAAHAVKRYCAQAADELSFEVSIQHASFHCIVLHLPSFCLVNMSCFTFCY